MGLQKIVALHRFEADLVCRKVASFHHDLRRDHYRYALLRQSLQPLEEIPVLREGHSADSVSLHHDRFVALRDELQYAGIHPRYQFEKEHLRLHVLVESDRSFRHWRHRVLQHPSSVYSSDHRVVDARESAEALRLELPRPRSRDRLTGKDDVHSAYSVFTREAYAVSQVLLRVSDLVHQRLLRARHDDRLRGVLDHVRERRGGISHRVRSVRDHESVVVIVFFFDRTADLIPVLRLHVRAVDPEKLHEVYVAWPCQPADALEYLFG